MFVSPLAIVVQLILTILSIVYALTYNLSGVGISGLVLISTFTLPFTALFCIWNGSILRRVAARLAADESIAGADTV